MSWAGAWLGLAAGGWLGLVTAAVEPETGTGHGRRKIRPRRRLAMPAALLIAQMETGWPPKKLEASRARARRPARVAYLLLLEEEYEL